MLDNEARLLINVSRWLTVGLVLAWAGTAAAQGQTTEKTPSTFDRIWRFAEWYRNDQRRIVQRVMFSGRYQHEFATLDADQGDHSEWNVRRMRLGPRLTMFRTIRCTSKQRSIRRRPIRSSCG